MSKIEFGENDSQIFSEAINNPPDPNKELKSAIEDYNDYVEKKDGWDELEDQYHMEEYPPFGGPFTNARTPWEWLKQYFEIPKRK